MFMQIQIDAIVECMQGPRLTLFNHENTYQKLIIIKMLQLSLTPY